MLLIFYGPVNVVELDRELRNSYFALFSMGGPQGGLTPTVNNLAGKARRLTWMV